MIGKIRGYLIVFILFFVAAIGAVVLAWVNFDRVWISFMSLAGEAFPVLARDSGPAAQVSGDANVEAAKLFTEAAYGALKAGRAKPGDLYELGQFYYKAKSDGHLDSKEMDQMIDLADKTGIMDAVIDQALEPTEGSGQASRSGKTLNLEAELKDLMRDAERVRADEHLNVEEFMGLLQKTRSSGLQDQLAGMLPPGYDQTRARAAVRDLAKAIITGRASIHDADSLMQMFLHAQADGRLDQKELDQITQRAEMLAR